MDAVSERERTLLKRIRQLSHEHRCQLEAQIEEMRQAEAAASRERLAAFREGFGAWADMTDEEAEALWQEIHALRGINEDDVPA